MSAEAITETLRALRNGPIEVAGECTFFFTRRSMYVLRRLRLHPKRKDYLRIRARRRGMA